MTTATSINRNGETAQVTFSNGETYAASVNYVDDWDENDERVQVAAGWSFHGTENGNQWQRDDFETLEEAIDDLEVYLNER